MRLIRALRWASFLVLAAVFSPEIQAASSGRNWQTFLGGALTTLAVHEGSHYFIAKQHGFDVDFSGLSIVYPDWDPSPQQKMRISTAGFQSQWIASELAFAKLEKKTDDAFYQGMVAGHIAISFAYTVLKEDDTSDIYAISSVSDLSRNQVLAFLLVPASIDAARLWMETPPKWLKNVSIASKGLGIAAIWKF